MTARIAMSTAIPIEALCHHIPQMRIDTTAATAVNGSHHVLFRASPTAAAMKPRHANSQTTPDASTSGEPGSKPGGKDGADETLDNSPRLQVAPKPSRWTKPWTARKPAARYRHMVAEFNLAAVVATR